MNLIAYKADGTAYMIDLGDADHIEVRCVKLPEIAPIPVNEYIQPDHSHPGDGEAGGVGVTVPRQEMDRTDDGSGN